MQAFRPSQSNPLTKQQDTIGRKTASGTSPIQHTLTGSVGAVRVGTHCKESIAEGGSERQRPSAGQDHSRCVPSLRATASRETCGFDAKRAPLSRFPFSRFTACPSRPSPHERGCAPARGQLRPRRVPRPANRPPGVVQRASVRSRHAPRRSRRWAPPFRQAP